MARYIDADELIRLIEIEALCQKYFNKRDVIACVKTINTSDVVPKSEVDRLVDKWIGEENLTQDAMVLRLIEALQDEAKRYERYYFNHEYDKLIAEAKQEVAREIFEEIEDITDTYGDEYGTMLVLDEEAFIELKKKYEVKQ